MSPKLSPQLQQRLAVAVPVIALILSLFFVRPAWGRYQDKKQQIVKRQAELVELNKVQIPDLGPVRPALEETPSEPPQFLSHLQALAAVAQCDISGFDVMPSDAPAEGPIRKAKAKVEVVGSYRQLRNFIGQLAQTDRLITITDAIISSELTANIPSLNGTGLRLTLQLERYVIPTSPAKPPDSL